MVYYNTQELDTENLKNNPMATVSRFKEIEFHRNSSSVYSFEIHLDSIV